MRCAEQSLLFAGDGHKNDRGVELIFRHHARHLHHGRRARRVVARARRIALGVAARRTDRIVMAADDVDSIFQIERLRLRAGQRGHDVDDPGGLGHATVRLLLELVFGDDEPSVRFAAVFVQFRFDPAPRRADATRGIVLRRQRVARAEARELADDRLDIGRGDFASNLFNLRVEPGGSLRLLRACGCDEPHGQQYDGE